MPAPHQTPAVHPLSQLPHVGLPVGSVDTWLDTTTYPPPPATRTRGTRDLAPGVTCPAFLPRHMKHRINPFPTQRNRHPLLRLCPPSHILSSYCPPAAGPSRSGLMSKAPGLALGPAAGDGGPASKGAGCPAQPLISPSQRWGSGEHRGRVSAGAPTKTLPPLPLSPFFCRFPPSGCFSVAESIPGSVPGLLPPGSFPVEQCLRTSISKSPGFQGSWKLGHVGPGGLAGGGVMELDTPTKNGTTPRPMMK